MDSMAICRNFAKQLREVQGKEPIRVKCGFPPLSWLDGELILIILQRKDIELREKVFRLLSEFSGEGTLSLVPLVYSDFEYRENCFMRSSFSAWLEAEGEDC